MKKHKRRTILMIIGIILTAILAGSKEPEAWHNKTDAYHSSYADIPDRVMAQNHTAAPVFKFYPTGNPSNNRAGLVHGPGGQESGSFLLTFGFYEKLDIATLADAAKQDAPGKKIIVHGQSMEAA